MSNKRTRLIIFSVLSIPVAWGVLQGYHLVLSKPIVEWALASYPQLFEGLAMPYPFAASLMNLIIFGTAAALWPRWGLGEQWKPERRQSVTVLILMGAAIIYPVLHLIFGGANPFKKMGFVIWTITPIQEEIIFRGFLYSLLLLIFKKTPEASLKEVWPVILLGSIWFALWHLSPHAIGKYGWRFMSAQLALTFAAGIVFNVLRYWTRSIWLVIPVHAAGNFMVSMM